MSMTTPFKQKGFTLIEVMVAILIVGMVLPALLINIMSQLDNSDYMRKKMVANWVATNKVTELQIANDQNQWKLVGKDSGTIEMLNTQWYWEVESRKFPQQELNGLVGVRVKVFENKKDETALSELFTILTL